MMNDWETTARETAKSVREQYLAVCGVLMGVDVDLKLLHNDFFKQCLN